MPSSSSLTEGEVNLAQAAVVERDDNSSCYSVIVRRATAVASDDGEDGPMQALQFLVCVQGVDDSPEQAGMQGVV